jgi:hypothetical protein
LEKLRRLKHRHRIANEMPDTMTAFGISGGWKRKTSKAVYDSPTFRRAD